MTTELERKWAEAGNVTAAEAVQTAIDALAEAIDHVKHDNYGSDSARLAGRHKAEHLDACIHKLRLMESKYVEAMRERHGP